MSSLLCDIHSIFLSILCSASSLIDLSIPALSWCLPKNDLTCTHGNISVQILEKCAVVLTCRPTPLTMDLTYVPLTSISVHAKCQENLKPVAGFIPSSFFALAFHNKFQYLQLNECTNSGNHLATSCTNLVNFGPVTRKMMRLICTPVYLYLAKIGLPTFICRTGLLKPIAW